MKAKFRVVSLSSTNLSLGQKEVDIRKAAAVEVDMGVAAEEVAAVVVVAAVAEEVAAAVVMVEAAEEAAAADTRRAAAMAAAEVDTTEIIDHIYNKISN